MTLTDTQLVLLSAASRREDGAIVPTPNLKGGVAGKVIGKLLREGLVEEVPAGASMPVWRRDDDAGPLSIRITPGGLASIGLEGDVMQLAKEPSTTEQRADGSPKRPPVRSLFEREEIRVRGGRPSPVVVNRSKPKCWRCSSVRRAQPLRSS
jgi:hypothetical protein